MKEIMKPLVKLLQVKVDDTELEERKNQKLSDTPGPGRVGEEIFNGKHERRKEGFRENICPTEMIERKYFIEEQNHYWPGALELWLH